MCPIRLLPKHREFTISCSEARVDRTRHQHLRMMMAHHEPVDTMHGILHRKECNPASAPVASTHVNDMSNRVLNSALRRYSQPASQIERQPYNFLNTLTPAIRDIGFHGCPGANVVRVGHH